MRCPPWPPCPHVTSPHSTILEFPRDLDDPTVRIRVSPRNRAGEPVVPVLAGQRDIYFGLQVAADPALYNTGLYIEATASLDLERLRAAVLATIDRAEAMRAVFTELDGELGQRVLPIEDFDVPIVDLRGRDAHQWMPRTWRGPWTFMRAR